MPQSKWFSRWACPECKRVYYSPVKGTLGVGCDHRGKRGSFIKARAMKQTHSSKYGRTDSPR